MAHLDDDQIFELWDVDSTREKAFRALIDKYKEKVYWQIRRIVHFHEDADDVVQNTFIKVWKNLDGFKRESKLYTWLYRIATNESLTFLKKKKKHQTIEIETDDYDLTAELKADPFFEGDEIQLKLQKAIALLPEKQRVVFNLRYYEEMKYDEMSEVLDTSVGALKASYHHAVKKIEKSLTED